MKDLLGGKGAGLAEMTNAGLPVPPGFTISTEVCNIYYREKQKIPAAIDREIRINNSNFYGDPNLTNGYNQESWPQFRRFLASVRLSY